MTIEEAIERIEDHMQVHKIRGYPHLQLEESLDMAVAALRAQAEPNAPLTLEELREMDGEPVWVERPGYGKKWALVQVWAKSTNVIYFTYNNGSTSLAQVELDCGGKACRRKPKEG